MKIKGLVNDKIIDSVRTLTIIIILIFDKQIAKISIHILLFFILIVFVTNHQYVYAPTFKSIWWLGNCPTCSEEDSTGFVIIYLTYPKKVEAGKNFEIGVTLENRKDEAVVADWLAFSNVSVTLRNATSPMDVRATPIAVDNQPKVVRPGDRYSQLFSIKAPDEEGLYVPFLNWMAWYGPGTTVLESFQYKSEYLYEKKDRKYGTITKEELPAIYVNNFKPEKAELHIEIDDPYGKFKPINVRIASIDKQFNEQFQVSNGERSIPLAINTTYRITLQDKFEMVPKEIGADFVSWSDGNTNNTRVIKMDQYKELYALYKTRYSLVVDSVEKNFLVDTKGSNWYDSGSRANYGVNLRNTLLSAFDHWEGDISSDANSAPAGQLVMDGPKKIIAVWRPDSTYLTTVIGVGGGILATFEVLSKKDKVKGIINKFTKLQKKYK